MSERHKVSLSPAFMLHARPYKDSSTIADFFTPEHGRVSLVARGARRPKSAIRSAMQPFQKVLLSWVSRSSLGTLTHVEIDAQSSLGKSRHLMSAFYLNELIIRSLRPGDSHSELFDTYERCLGLLNQGSEEASALRYFERDLLEELGYALPLARDVNGENIQSGCQYRYQPGHGLMIAGHGEPISIAGSSITALANGQLESVEELRDSKRLLRIALDFHLGNGESRVRDVTRRLHQSLSEWRQGSGKSGEGAS